VRGIDVPNSTVLDAPEKELSDEDYRALVLKYVSESNRWVNNEMLGDSLSKLPVLDVPADKVIRSRLIP
jgi:hypothetical protein